MCLKISVRRPGFPPRRPIGIPGIPSGKQGIPHLSVSFDGATRDEENWLDLFDPLGSALCVIVGAGPQRQARTVSLTGPRGALAFTPPSRSDKLTMRCEGHAWKQIFAYTRSTARSAAMTV